MISRTTREKRIPIDDTAKNAMIDLYNMKLSYARITYRVREMGYAADQKQVSDFLKSKGLGPRGSKIFTSKIY